MAVCIEVRVRSNLIAALSLDNVSDPLTPANATWSSVARKGPVKPHSRPFPGQHERQRMLSVSDLSNTRQRHMVVCIEERVRSTPIAALSLDNVSASERCP